MSNPTTLQLSFTHCHITSASISLPRSGLVQQMRPGSQFLIDLNKTQSKLGEMPVVSYRTPMDLIILPPTNSVWERAENLEFNVILHPLMLSSDAVLTDIEQRLLR
jgi:hypothetical protein